jgi:hypothetical protein
MFYIPLMYTDQDNNYDNYSICDVTAKKESPDAKMRIRVIELLNQESRILRVSDRFLA